MNTYNNKQIAENFGTKEEYTGSVKLRNRLRKTVGKMLNGRIIDAGCGNGLLLKEIDDFDLYVGVGKENLKKGPGNVYAKLTVGCANDNKITGSAVFAPPITEEQKGPFIGEYSVNPSFRAKIDYNLSVYEKLILASNGFIEACKTSQNIAGCVENNKASIFNSVNLSLVECQTEEQKKFDGFLDYFIRCKEANDKSCYCDNNLGSGKFEISKNDKDLLIKSGDNQYTIPDTDIYYQDLSLKGSMPFDLEKDYINKGQNGELIILPKKATPIGAASCKNVKQKTSFKFCAKDNKQFYAYDPEDRETKLRDVVYKFALSLT